ncbi:MAG: hypothetical protein VX869_00470, partial [Chloroflexota bacterium]|nr:hypothetical protein [Chloroflexota bacterium]
KQDLRDRDDEAEGSRSKDRPTAESFSAILDEKKEKYWAEKRKKQNLRDRDDEAEATRSKKHPTAEEVDEEETVIITSMEQLEELDHEDFGFETREDMYEYVEAELQEKEVDVPDTRRTVDAIRAYYRSKDASRDATYDTDKGKKGKGDKEKKYAKKERGEIDKDDPNWKHRAYHTGMHGEAKDSFVVPASASPSKAAPGEGGIPKPSDAKIDGDVKNDKKKEHKDAKEVQDIDNRESNVGESMSPLMAAVVADISKRTEKKKLVEKYGEKDIGTDSYADYTKNLTPGQSAGTVPPANPSITDDDAKKADKKQKEDNAQKQRQATVVDDEYHVDMPMHELLGIPFTAKARLARQQKKGARIKTRTDLATAKLSNIQARDKLKAAKAKLRDARAARSVNAEYQPEDWKSGEAGGSRQAARKAELDKQVADFKKTGGKVKKIKSPERSARDRMTSQRSGFGMGATTLDLGKGRTLPKKKHENVDRSPDKSGGKGVETPDEIMGVKVKKLKPSLKGMSKTRRAVVKRRNEEVEIDELSKATLGRYVKRASTDAAHSGIDLGVSANRKGGQSRKDVDTHAGKMVKRQKGIGKAVDKLSKEDMSLAPKGKGRKAAKRMYGEDTSIVDAVQEVLGLGNKWQGMEKMPPVDKKTGKYVTGKSKIQRLPKKQNLRDRDDEAQATRSKKHPTAEEKMDEANPHPHLRRKGPGLADSPGARARTKEGARTASQGKAGRKHGAIAPARGDWTQTQWGKGSPV